ncbi:MAG: 4Fe-4S dicluster domain-containing protein [Gracilibacteraceae bacterium]|jgi:NAD-dependent dihydropyrimidine dehydrogenase PreA subunit|nr:4Fe-4S dicluster domain-containing protein [Gracilibacteraceae bacterium]
MIYIGGTIVALWFIGGIYRHVRGLGKIIVVIDDNCTGCKACLKKCRYNVLEPENEEKGARVIVKKPLKCNACGDCLSACKFNALKIIEK